MTVICWCEGVNEDDIHFPHLTIFVKKYEHVGFKRKPIVIRQLSSKRSPDRWRAYVVMGKSRCSNLSYMSDIGTGTRKEIIERLFNHNNIFVNTDRSLLIDESRKEPPEIVGDEKKSIPSEVEDIAGFTLESELNLPDRLTEKERRVKRAFETDNREILKRFGKTYARLIGVEQYQDVY